MRGNIRPSRAYARRAALLGSVLLALAADAGHEVEAAGAAASSAPLPFFYGLHTFRGEEPGGTTVIAAVAVPVRGLRNERVEESTRYRFDVRFVLADTVDQSVVDTIDSVYVSFPGALGRQHLLHTVVELLAPPSRSTLHRVVVTDATRPGVGQLYDSPFPVPDYSGSRLMLSDLAFGLPDVEGGWTRRGMTLALLPTSQFPESSFDVYYEIYNLASGTPYDTEIAIQPVDDDGEDRGPRATASFSGESAADAGGTVGVLRRVESALDEGRYRLTVTVTNRITGGTASRARIVDVVGWGRGATLVPALPKRTLESDAGR